MTEEETRLRLGYAGAIGLLCQLSVHLRDGRESDDYRELIERACLDWAAGTKWGVRRILDRIEVEPPRSQLEQSP